MVDLRWSMMLAGGGRRARAAGAAGTGSGAAAAGAAAAAAVTGSAGAAAAGPGHGRGAASVLDWWPTCFILTTRAALLMFTLPGVGDVLLRNTL